MKCLDFLNIKYLEIKLFFNLKYQYYILIKSINIDEIMYIIKFIRHNLLYNNIFQNEFNINLLDKKIELFLKNYRYDIHKKFNIEIYKLIYYIKYSDISKQHKIFVITELTKIIEKLKIY
jgi:hypothetical protein